MIDATPTPVRPSPTTLARRCLGLLMLLVSAGLGPAVAQGAPATTIASAVRDIVQRDAQAAFAGPDRVGKDGPLAPLGYELALLHTTATRERVVASELAAVATGMIVRDGLVLIDAIAAGDAASLQADLEALGLRDGARFGAVVSGLLPIAELDETAALVGLRSARPSRAARRAGDVTSQAFEAMNVDLATTLFGVDGSGVAVGTLSDSYACLTGAPTAADDVASGDLPAGVTVLAELSGCSGAIDEGRAMMQLIHDLAPGASQLFHSAFNGYADFAQGILDLADAGADVIVDDIIYFAEPMFQDGIVALAVERVVADGVPYFSSAGNQADQSYESAFRPVAATVGGLASDFHDFDPGPGTDVLQQVTVPANRSATFILQWDDPSAETAGAGPDADVDFHLLDAAGTSILFSSQDDNVAGGVPVEGFQVSNSSGAPATYNLAIELWGLAPGGAAPTIVKYVDYGDAVADEYATGSPTSYGHANAAGARSVAAASYLDTPRFGQVPPLPEAFTSLSGVPILFDLDGDRLAVPDLRPKPDLTGVDGTDTTFFGADVEPNGFPNFFGTSAAAPHAAAVAALLLELDPTLTPQAVYDALQVSATDMGVPGFDALTGHGLVQADATMAALPGLTLAEGPAAPDDELTAAPGDAVAVLQLVASLRNDFPAATLDALELQIDAVGQDGTVGDVARVLLYDDADGDGGVGPGQAPLASAIPSSAGAATLSPSGGMSVGPGTDATMLVVVEFDAALSSLASGGWTWALTLPALFGVASFRRRRRGWLTLALLTGLLTACPSTPAPPEVATGRFEIALVGGSATYDGSTTPATVTGVPVVASVIEIVNP